ncbi:MAG: TonB-dependent receptor [Acidobacteriota bacterium]|nr:TonB-dependent receptor [Acidobacteriota bacterium]
MRVCDAISYKRINRAVGIIVCWLSVTCGVSASTPAMQEAAAVRREVHGVVLDVNRAPIANADVSLTAASRVLAHTTTAEDGSFTLMADPSPMTTLVVSARGFATSTQGLQASQESSTRLEIVLEAAGVEADVTVTATRTVTRLDETAASVVVLGRTDLEETAAVTIDDALRQVPGFSLFRRSGSRYANPTAQGVSLRGVGASGASRALVVADGVPLLDPFGGWVYWGRVPRAAVNRIEVLRGAASDLYGTGALSGVININRRTASASSLSFETSYGSQSSGEASLFAAGRKGQWSASLAAEGLRTDGSIPVQGDERGPVDTAANSRRAGGDLTLERFFGERNARVLARASYYGESRANGTRLQFNRTGIRQFSAGADGQLPIVGSLSARIYGGTQTYDQTFSAVSADRASETLTRVQRVPAQSFGLTTQSSRALGSRNTLVAGFDLRAVRGASDEIIYTGGSAASLVGAGGRERTVAVFASDIFRLSDRLIFTVGVRFDGWLNYRALATTRSLTSSVVIVREFEERRESALSPRASVFFRATNNLSFVASAGRAFRQPTLNELYRAFRVGNILTLANENLSAERLTGGEGGAVFTFFNSRLTARTVAFLSETTDPVANVTLSVTPALITRQRQNLGCTGTRGFEAEVEARLSSRFSISSGYLFADARVTEFPADRALEGLFLPQVARHQLTFQAAYSKPSLATVSVQGRASSSQFDDDQNQSRLRRYFALDAVVSRRLSKHSEVFIAAENLTNTRIETGRTPVLTVGPPLLGRVGVRLRLGAE